MKILGIDLKIHVSCILWPALIAYQVFTSNSKTPFADFCFMLAYFCAIYSCVIMHEYGHCLAARGFGIKTKDIVIYPIGGLASLESIPQEPFKEMVITVAGPMVNVVILGAILLANWGLPLKGSFLYPLFFVNLMLILFNLLPAFPMDGGRIFRSGMAFFTRYYTATRIATYVGQVMGCLMTVYGFLYSPFLIITGLFVIVGAWGERVRVRAEIADGNIKDE